MIEEKYKQLCAIPSDINENLHVLKEFAEKSDSIVELGVRYIVSTWALLAGKPKSLLSIDITHPKDYGGNVDEVYEAAEAEGINFHFIIGDSLKVTLEEHDMLFIDTLHTYEQLSKELERHHEKVQKYIAMHDTAIPDLPEMLDAVNEFIEKHPEWKVAEHHTNCNGMTVLSKI